MSLCSTYIEYEANVSTSLMEQTISKIYCTFTLNSKHSQYNSKFTFTEGYKIAKTLTAAQKYKSQKANMMEVNSKSVLFKI